MPKATMDGPRFDVERPSEFKWLGRRWRRIVRDSPRFVYESGSLRVKEYHARDRVRVALWCVRGSLPNMRKTSNSPSSARSAIRRMMRRVGELAGRSEER